MVKLLIIEVTINMKKIKLKITINGETETTTKTCTHNENEVLYDIVMNILKELHIKEQKFVILVNNILDSGNVKLSSYNDKPIKKRIVVVLEECMTPNINTLTICDDKGDKCKSKQVISICKRNTFCSLQS